MKNEKSLISHFFPYFGNVRVLIVIYKQIFIEKLKLILPDRAKKDQGKGDFYIIQSFSPQSELLRIT